LNNKEGREMEFTNDSLVSEAQQSVCDSVQSLSYEEIVTRATQNMSDDNDYPDERELVRAVVEVLYESLRDQGILPEIPPMPDGLRYFSPPF